MNDTLKHLNRIVAAIKEKPDADTLLTKLNDLNWLFAHHHRLCVYRQETAAEIRRRILHELIDTAPDCCLYDLHRVISQYTGDKRPVPHSAIELLGIHLCKVPHS